MVVVLMWNLIANRWKVIANRWKVIVRRCHLLKVEFRSWKLA